MLKRTLWIALLVLLSASLVAAQEDSCPPLIQTALERVGESCSALTRNTVCYGNVSLQAEANPDASNFKFADVGDIVNLSDLVSLQTSPLDEAKDTWGVALLAVQADLPDTLPGQNVTMMVYGDSTLTPQLTVTLNVSANEVINIRKEPNTSAEIVGKLAASTTLKADGRLEDNSWVRVTTPEGVVGWVSTTVASVDGDLASLKVRTPDDTSSGAQSAFYFTSGIGRSACAELPSGGILLQSPDGTNVDLVINDVNIEIGSTVAVRFLDKVPGATEADPLLPHLAFYVLEGGIKKVTLTGDTPRQANLPTVEQGLVLYVPVDETTGLPNGQPPLIKPYDQDDMDSLAPLAAALPVPVTPAAPLSAEAFDALQKVSIQAGAWTFTTSGQSATCLDNNQIENIDPILPSVASKLTGTISEDKTNPDILILQGSGVPVPLTLTRTDASTFSGTSDYGEMDFRLVSPTQAVLRVVTPLMMSNGAQSCDRTEFFLLGTAAP